MKTFSDLNIFPVLLLFIIVIIVLHQYCGDDKDKKYCSRKQIIKSILGGISRGLLLGIMVLDIEFGLVTALALGIINPIITILEHQI